MKRIGSKEEAARNSALPAIEVRQGPKRTLYSFAIDGKMLSEFTTVSRVRRPEASAIEGYQRPEVLSHIAEIRDYLEAGDPMIPNAVVVAFDQRVRFEPASTARTEGPKYTRVGSLVIPVHRTSMTRTARVDRRRTTAHCRYSSGPHRELPHLRRGLHHW